MGYLIRMLFLMVYVTMPLMIFFVRILFQAAYYVVVFIIHIFAIYPKAFIITLVAITLCVFGFLLVQSYYIGRINDSYERFSVSPVVTQAPTRISKPVISGKTATVLATRKSSEMRTVLSVELNVRSSPNPDEDNIIKTLKRNMQVMLTGQIKEIDGNTWVEIEINGGKGWVNAKYLRP